MNEEEFERKMVHLRVLKDVQEYLKPDSPSSTALHPIRVPNELLYQTVKHQGAETADRLIHHIFTLGLSVWSERKYNEVFGSEEALEEFIQLVKDRNKE